MTNLGRRIAVTAGLLFACGSTAACAGAPPAAVAPSTHGVAPADRAAAAGEIAKVLDDVNDAAAHADEARYFGHFADDSVFLGTDGTERWEGAAFRAFAHPHFAAGKAWSFRAVRRAVTVSDDGRFAYFDEDLATEKLGPARGSGVLALRGGAWKIVQYDLATVVPNDRFAEVRALLDRPAVPAQAPFEKRYHAAYDRAVEAATKGDLATADRTLYALVDEAESREGDATAFWLRNELTWVRWGLMDMAGALREVDAAEAARVKVHVPEEKSARLSLHSMWDRAYLLREIARTAPAADRAKALAAAEAARADYEKAATPLGDHDGMAVLSAFFAVYAHDVKAAKAALKAIDDGKDDDMQDIYVLSFAADLAGDHAKAAALRARVRASRDYLLKPLLVRELDVSRLR